MSLAEAKRHELLADFPFPPSAHDIYVAAYADWITIETLIRFDASETDCKASVPKILEWSQKYETKKKDYPITALTEEVALPGPTDAEWLPDVKWWTGLKVKHGYFSGEEEWDFRQVWIDSDLGRVYFYQAQ